MYQVHHGCKEALWVDLAGEAMLNQSIRMVDSCMRLFWREAHVKAELRRVRSHDTIDLIVTRECHLITQLQHLELAVGSFEQVLGRLSPIEHADKLLVVLNG